MKNIAQHSIEVNEIAKKIKKYSQSANDKKLRFYHGDTNSTRMQGNKNYYWVDISNFSEVVEINTAKKYALVEPNIPMDKLIKITLQYGLLPPVVMEFPGITVGGGINGATLENSSYKYGQFCDTCEEYEIVLGNGEIVKASPRQNQDIFYGMSGAYGTLGLLSLIKVKLISSAYYVHTKYYPVKTYEQTLSLLKEQIKKAGLDYIEGIIFDSKHSVVITGKLVNNGKLPIKTYTKTKDPWFYEIGKKIAKRQFFYEELIPITDYLFRYNRGAFWMGEYVFPFFHIPNNKITRYLLNPFINTRKLYDGMHAVNMSQDYFIQDFYVPFEKAEKFLEYTEKRLKIFPIWLCPMKPTTTAQKLSPHYIKTDMLVDIGIWGQTDKYLADPIMANKEFEKFAKNNNSRKMLYAHTYYTEDKFWNIYDKEWYDSIRAKYHADKVFPNVWQKVHVSERYSMHKLRGVFKVLGKTLLGKHINA